MGAACLSTAGANSSYLSDIQSTCSLQSSTNISEIVASTSDTSPQSKNSYHFFKADKVTVNYGSITGASEAVGVKTSSRATRKSSQGTAASSPSTSDVSDGQGSCTSEETAVSKPLHRKLISVGVSLHMKQLWEDFNALGTEMIVTKAGRYLINLYVIYSYISYRPICPIGLYIGLYI